MAASTHRMAVSLRAADPAAVTAAETLRRTMPRHAPAELGRYDHWEVRLREGGSGELRRMVERTDEMANPNKQVWTELTGCRTLPGEDPSLTWVSVLVTDVVDSVSENWTALLSLRYPVESVRLSVLWRLGYPEGTPEEEALDRAEAVAVSRDRRGGLLANPVSQRVVVRTSLDD